MSSFCLFRIAVHYTQNGHTTTLKPPVARSIPRAVFGVKANVRDNVHFFEDNAILYPAGVLSVRGCCFCPSVTISPPPAFICVPGNYLVKYFLQTKAQEFAPCSDTGLGVTAMVCGRGSVLEALGRCLRVAIRSQALSTTRRYTAVAEKSVGHRGGCISVFNVRTLTKRRTLTIGGYYLVKRRRHSFFAAYFSIPLQTLACTPPNLRRCLFHWTTR